MRKFFSVIAVILLLSIFGCSREKEVIIRDSDRIPVTLTDDFETGELFAWECYPYAQDIGYDPGTVCLKEPAHNKSRYALARIVKPNDALDLSQGFTKQIDLWTTEETRLTFALFLISDRKPEKVDISLGLFDGRLYTHTVNSPEVNTWMEIDVPAMDFLHSGERLSAGEHIQVIAIKAFYPLVSHLISYTILIDDVSISGERPRRFIVQSAPSTTFERFGFSILNTHYCYGDTVGLAVTTEGGREVDYIEGALYNPEGTLKVGGIKFYDDGTHGDEKSDDNIWSNDSIYTILADDTRGHWTLSLTGGSVDAPDMTDEFRFLVPGKRLISYDHPRLFFSEKEITARLAEDESTHVRTILDNALARRDRYADIEIDGIEEDTNVPDESLTGGPYSRVSTNQRQWLNPAYTLAGIVEAGAWQYYLNGDEEAGERAKKALIKFSKFEAWNRSWMESHGRHIYFPVGYMARRVAIGYDLLYPLLSDKEKKTVRDGIMNNAIKPFYRDMVEMNRMPSNLSNHIAVIVAGLGLAATTIYGDDPGNPTLEPYLSGIMAKMKDFMDKTYFPEGSYGEPYTYQAMASRDLTETLFAFERNFGVDYTSTTDLKDVWVYPLYATHSSGRYQDFGDVSLRYGMTQTHMQWLTYRMENPWTYAYLEPHYESGRGGIFGYLWYTEGIFPRYRDELPTSKLFTHKGNMIMRSDWDDEGSIMIFKCGPNSNHYHLDQGTFVIMTNGTELLSDAGHSSGYYSNLYYPGYYTQAIGHNVMLVDRNPESQGIADYENGVAALRNYPKIIRHFAGDIADEVKGDLTCVYKDELTAYTRSLLFMKPDLIFLFDRVKSAREHEYNWLFHAEHTDGESSITSEGNRVEITRTKARLTIDVLAPEIVSSRIRNSDRDESFITLSSDKGLTDTAFLSVLMPEPVISGGDSLDVLQPKPKAQLIESDGWIGARIDYEGAYDMAMFRTGESGETDTVANIFDTDADHFALTIDTGGRVSRMYLSQGTILVSTGDDSYIFTGTHDITAAISHEGIITRLEADTEQETGITFSVYRVPETVLIDDSEFEEWSYNNAEKTMTVQLPKGHAVLVIR